jgi:hypothetical protein
MPATATPQTVVATPTRGPSGLTVRELQAVLGAIGDREDTCADALERACLRGSRQRLSLELGWLLRARILAEDPCRS